MTSWIVGDIHGCADELGELVARIALEERDILVCVGDLFHRGPDPVGVMDRLRGVGARFVLGNHELAVLRRCGLAPASTDPLDRPPRRQAFPELEADDLRGDGGRSCDVPSERREDVVRFLQEHAGFFLRGSDLEGAGRTPDGRAWYVVHAGMEPDRGVERSSIEALTRARRVDDRGRPFWYERYEGPDLVLFGHTPGKVPRARHHAGRLVALGLDTGCVYGGALSAYSPELDEIVSVRASKAYAEP